MHARWLVALALAGCSAGEEVTVNGPDAAAAPDAVVDVVRPIDVAPYDITPLDVVRGEDVVPEAAVDTGPDVITREQFCMGAGPPVVVGDRVTMSTRCVGRIAEAVFRHAICTCTDLGLAGYLQTDSFDSGASMMMAENGGAVGINGGLSLVGVMRIGDALTMSGTAPLRLIGAHTVRGDLALQGDLQVAGTLDVERNARIRGNLLAIGPFRVRGDLTTQPGTLPLGVINVSGARRSANVDVAPPCACRDSEIFDVRGAVTDASARNDNAAAGFRRDVFNGVVGEARVELPCGRFFVERIAGLFERADGRIFLRFFAGGTESTGFLRGQATHGAVRTAMLTVLFPIRFAGWLGSVRLVGLSLRAGSVTDNECGAEGAEKHFRIHDNGFNPGHPRRLRFFSRPTTEAEPPVRVVAQAGQR